MKRQAFVLSGAGAASRHSIGTGVFSGMLFATTIGTSLESLIDGPRGYPEILQTGGAYQGARIANREHPHPALMQLGASYDQTLMSGLALSTYAAANTPYGWASPGGAVR